MTRSVENVVTFVCLALEVVLSTGSATASQKYRARDLFADPKVAELAEAAAQGNVERVDALIAEGVDLNARGREGLTPLMYALGGTSTKSFERLLEAGADPNEQTDRGESAISIAAREADSEHLKTLLKVLLAHGGNPNLPPRPSGRIGETLRITRPTPIYEVRDREIARILIKAGAHLDARDDSRGTPAMRAAGHKRFDVVYTLLAAGADFRLEDVYGETLAQCILESELVPMREPAAWRRECMELTETLGVDFREEKAAIEERLRRRDEWHKRAEEKERRGECSGSLLQMADSVACLVLAGADFPQSRRTYLAKDFFAVPEVAELAEAARRGDVARVEALVAQGVDVNARAEQGLTPLLYTMSGKEIKGFKRLLELGADPNQHTDCGESAMKWAAYQNESEHLKALLAHGGDPDLRYPTADIHATPLHWAVQGPCVENARVLIAAGADARAEDANGSALLCAAQENRFDMLCAIVEAPGGFRPSQEEDSLLARFILESFVDRDSEGEKWRQKCIQSLSQKGVDFEKARREIAESEREQRADIRRPEEVWLLSAGPWAFDWNVARILLFVNVPSGRRCEAQRYFADPKVAELAEAAAAGDVDRIDALIGEGVNPNAKGLEWLTPLIFAMTGKNTQNFKRLLELGADPNHTMVYGESAMHCAAHENGSERLKILLAHGGDPNVGVRSRPLPTPIFWAIAGPSAENVQILIQAGADIHLRDSAGNTPLLKAITSNRFDMVHMLLAAGADFQQKLSSGRTLAEYIFYSPVDLRTDKAEWRQKCIELMEEKGADFETEKRKATEIFRRVDEVAREIEEDMRSVREKRKSIEGAAEERIMSIP